jgi:hypothetical protein
VFWMWGIRRSEYRRPPRVRVVFRLISRGADLARFKLIAIKLLLLLLDINVQCSGVEMIDSRQYRRTRVSGIIDLASEA